MLLTIVLFFHILAAIVAVGFNISYFVWIVRARSSPTNMAFALKGVKFIDNRIANPAYGVLLLTGLLLVYLGHYSSRTLWIDVALILFVALIVIAAFFYSPALRQQVALAEAGDTSSAEFTRLSVRGQTLGQILGAIVLVILVMMVFKPNL
jgi:uncharacterized membrane protein